MKNILKKEVRKTIECFDPVVHSIKDFTPTFTNALSNKHSAVVLPDGEPIHTCDKDDVFTGMCDCIEKYIKPPKWS